MVYSSQVKPPTLQSLPILVEISSPPSPASVPNLSKLHLPAELTPCESHPTATTRAPLVISKRCTVNSMRSHSATLSSMSAAKRLLPPSNGAKPNRPLTLRRLTDQAIWTNLTMALTTSTMMMISSEYACHRYLAIKQDLHFIFKLMGFWGFGVLGFFRFR